MPFEYTTRVQLYHTDSAGILFYSKIFELAFQAYDAFLEECGASVHYIINEADYTIPFVHAEADYLSPLVVDDRVTITLHVDKTGETSFTLRYDIHEGDQLAAQVKTVHVTVSKKTRAKVQLPEKIRQGLEKCSST